MKVFVVTYPCAEGRIECKCRRALQTEVHQTLEAAKAATEGRMFVQILECEVGASWQSSTQTWTEPDTLDDPDKALERERRRCDTWEQEVCRINGRLVEEKAKVAALEAELAELREAKRAWDIEHA
jgi:hypothetical protein